jgi:hypothetical protein
MLVHAARSVCGGRTVLDSNHGAGAARVSGRLARGPYRGSHLNWIVRLIVRHFSQRMSLHYTLSGTVYMYLMRPRSVAHCFGHQMHRPDLDKLVLPDGVILWQSLASS